MAELGSGSNTSYPAALDTDVFRETTTTYARADVPNDLAAAVIAIETELGTDPAGAYADVKTRLDALAGGKVVIIKEPGAATLPNSGFATLEKESGSTTVDYIAKFPDATYTTIYFKDVIPDFYSGGNLKISLHWKASITSGTAIMYVETRTPNNDEIWDSLATPSAQTTTITCLNDGSVINDLIIDSATLSTNLPTAGDAIQIKIRRDGADGSDNMTVDLELLKIKIEEE